VIIENAFSTQVIGPPFLNLCPFADETTIGFTLFFITLAACPELVDENGGAAAAAASPAVLVTTKSRREILSGMARAPHGSAFAAG
jgi:hypothetical protein